MTSLLRHPERVPSLFSKGLEGEPPGFAPARPKRARRALPASVHAWALGGTMFGIVPVAVAWFSGADRLAG